jgi:hypothetical protein
MRDRAVLEEHLDTKAVQFAERQLALRQKMLDISERAADQAEKMLEWPLTEQKIFREGAGDDGEDVTMIFKPAGWSKATIGQMVNIAASGVAGSWATKAPEQEDEAEYDFSDFTEEELATYIELSDKLGVGRRARV